MSFGSRCCGGAIPAALPFLSFAVFFFFFFPHLGHVRRSRRLQTAFLAFGGCEERLTNLEIRMVFFFCYFLMAYIRMLWRWKGGVFLAFFLFFVLFL